MIVAPVRAPCTDSRTDTNLWLPQVTSMPQPRLIDRGHPMLKLTRSDAVSRIAHPTRRPRGPAS